MHNSLRVDLELIFNLITPGSRVLDLGCGGGELLERLIRDKQARGFGVEISHEGIQACIDRGVPVFHGDIDQGLSDHHDQAFDYVILTQTLQAIHRPQFALQEMLRVGQQGVVSLPNFGYWRIRRDLLLHGRMPKTPLLPYDWYETPNIRMCTILDFEELCRQMAIQIVQRIPLTADGRRLEHPIKSAFANTLAPMAVYLLCKGSPS